MDIAKGIAILFVINVHIPVEYRLIDEGITFHLSTFFLITGMLYYKKNTKLSKKLLTKKIRSLLIPYYKLSLICLVFIIIYNYVVLSSFDFQEIVRNAVKIISFNGIGTLWFLPTMLFSSLLFLYIEKQRKEFSLVLPIANIVSLYVANCYNISFAYILLRVFVCSFYIQIGYKIAPYVIKYEKKKYHDLKQLFIILFLFFCNYFLSKDKYFDLRSLASDDLLSSIISPIVGALMIIFVSMYLKKFNVISNIFSYFGKNSLIIMATHLEYRIIDLSVLIYSLFLSEYVNFIAIFVLIMLIEIVLVQIINKTKLKYLFSSG